MGENDVMVVNDVMVEKEDDRIQPMKTRITS